jgi:hypothetical protein
MDGEVLVIDNEYSAPQLDFGASIAVGDDVSVHSMPPGAYSNAGIAVSFCHRYRIGTRTIRRMVPARVKTG